MKRIFLSYSSKTKEEVGSLVDDLRMLGYDVWFDSQLSGGETWWSRILSEIQKCEIFLFALSPEAINSTACIREFKYALALEKSVLPVKLTGNVSLNLMPRELSGLQIIDYRLNDKAASLAIGRAINNLPVAQPLPVPLPPPPEVPISYLDKLKDQVENPQTLTFENQSTLVLRLKDRYSQKDLRNDVRSLLLMMRQRTDLYARIGEEIDEILNTRQSQFREDSPKVKAQTNAKPDEKPKKRVQFKSGSTNSSTAKILNFLLYSFWIIFFVITTWLWAESSRIIYPDPDTASVTFSWISSILCGLATVQFIYFLISWRKINSGDKWLSIVGLIASLFFFGWSMLIEGSRIQLSEVLIAWYLYIPTMLIVSLKIVNRRFSTE